MIYWYGREYPLIKGYFNGTPAGYMLDGIVTPDRPKHTTVRGYIEVPEGRIIILRRIHLMPVIFLTIVLLAVTVLYWPVDQYVYFPVTFESEPVYEDGTLYCNVVNEAEESVTVQFIGLTQASQVYTVLPGDSLPYVEIEFKPFQIRYNGEFTFDLKAGEVND